jgi:hypothetical protein
MPDGAEVYKIRYRPKDGNPENPEMILIPIRSEQNDRYFNN